MEDKEKLDPLVAPPDIDVACFFDTRRDYFQLKVYQPFRTENMARYFTANRADLFSSEHSHEAVYHWLRSHSTDQDLRASIAEFSKRRAEYAKSKAAIPPEPKPSPEPPKLSTDGVVSFIALLPDPKSRKLVKKMAADQFAHIEELERSGKIGAARWQLAATWGLVFWYGVLYSISSVARAVRGKIAG